MFNRKCIDSIRVHFSASEVSLSECRCQLDRSKVLNRPPVVTYIRRPVAAKTSSNIIQSWLKNWDASQILTYLDLRIYEVLWCPSEYHTNKTFQECTMCVMTTPLKCFNMVHLNMTGTKTHLETALLGTNYHIHPYPRSLFLGWVDDFPAFPWSIC